VVGVGMLVVALSGLCGLIMFVILMMLAIEWFVFGWDLRLWVGICVFIVLFG